MITFTFDLVRGETVVDDEKWREKIINVMLKRKRKAVWIRKDANIESEMYILHLKKVTDKEKADLFQPSTKVRYKNRIPNPGPCSIISIDYRDKRMQISDGSCLYFPTFDEVEPCL